MSGIWPKLDGNLLKATKVPIEVPMQCWQAVINWSKTMFLNLRNRLILSVKQEGVEQPLKFIGILRASWLLSVSPQNINLPKKVENGF